METRKSAGISFKELAASSMPLTLAEMNAPSHSAHYQTNLFLLCVRQLDIPKAPGVLRIASDTPSFRWLRAYRPLDRRPFATLLFHSGLTLDK